MLTISKSVLGAMDLCFRTKFHGYFECPAFLLRYVLTIQRCCTPLRLYSCLLALLDVSVVRLC